MTAPEFALALRECADAAARCRTVEELSLVAAVAEEVAREARRPGESLAESLEMMRRVIERRRKTG